MGNNLDLTQMLGVEEHTMCPRCGKTVSTYADDYDIECGDPNPKPGEWSLSICCPECGHEWEYKFSVAPVPDKTYRILPRTPDPILAWRTLSKQKQDLIESLLFDEGFEVAADCLNWLGDPALVALEE